MRAVDRCDRSITYKGSVSRQFLKPQKIQPSRVCIRGCEAQVPGKHHVQRATMRSPNFRQYMNPPLTSCCCRSDDNCAAGVASQFPRSD